MSVITTNLIQGPATLYSGFFGATEPADTAVNTTPQASAWTDCGGTQGGVSLSITQTYVELDVDQITVRVGSRLTKADYMVETTFAEVTLTNLAFVLNGGTSASGAGYASLDPNVTSSATQPLYTSMLFDGWAPNNFKRRVIARKVLSTDNVIVAYTKDKQTVLAAKFAAHYVSSSITPIHIVDQTS